MAKWNATNTGSKVVTFSDDPIVKKLIRKGRIKVAVIILVLLAIIGSLAKPAYSSFRNHQIEKNLEDARSAVRVEDWATARSGEKRVDCTPRGYGCIQNLVQGPHACRRTPYLHGSNGAFRQSGGNRP